MRVNRGAPKAEKGAFDYVCLFTRRAPSPDLETHFVLRSLQVMRSVPAWARYTFLCTAVAIGGRAAYAQTAAVLPNDPVTRASASRLEPGDRIVVHVLREPLLSDTVMVSEKSEAAFAKLGVINVGAFSIGQLQDTLRAEYSKYLRNPAIEIVVLRRVAVNGEVKNPDVYLIDVSTTLRDVIARAGGITETGDRKKVDVVRGSNRVRIKGWEADQGSAGDLRSGDQVIVGRKSWWVLNALPAVSTTVVIASLLLTISRR
jgi:protein involved in polysaccharide export with SLBB domain